MDFFIRLLFMIVIGAAIGGLTNYIAIKMLFRPYQAVYIGKWKVPFTPGVIPNRRDEMAVQMGRMVVEHLLTAESIKKKMLTPTFQNKFVDLILKKWGQLKKSELTAEMVLAKVGIENSRVRIEGKLDDFIESSYGNMMNQYRDRSIETILTPAIIEKVEGKLPDISRYILGKGVDYFQSTEGKFRIQRMIDEFMRERGMFGNMMQMLLGNVNLVDKIQPELIRFLENEGTEETLTSVLKKEWEKVLQWEVKELETQFEKANLLKLLKKAARKIIDVDEFLHKPFKDYGLDIDDSIEIMANKAVFMFGEWLQDKVEQLMERLHLKEMVQEQVESFSVERLEMMVLSIVQKEFKMITYLGAVLGAVIGLVQAFILYLL